MTIVVSAAHEPAPLGGRPTAARRAAFALVLGLLFAGAPLLGGCDEDLPGERGDLGVGNFVYRCVGVTDTACVGDEVTLPQALAVGSRFDMTFAVREGPLPMVISPAQHLVRRNGGVFEVLAPGLFSLLAVTGNTEVVDLKHLRAAAIAEIRVQQGNELPSVRLTLARGQSVTLNAVPFDLSGVMLGGALTYSWRSSDERILTVETLPQLSSVRVRGGVDGDASLLVTAAGQMFTVMVRVGVGAPDARVPLDAGTSPIDAAVSAVDAAIDAALGGDR